MISILVALMMSQPSLASRVLGKFQVVEGDVQSISKRGRTKKARFGRSVKQGDSVTTGPESRAKIIFLDKNTFFIGPDSKVDFKNYKQEIEGKEQTVVHLVYGKLRSTLQEKYDEESKTFRVETNVAIAGVRGTDFITEFDGDQANFDTIEGSIVVGLPGLNGNIVETQRIEAGLSTVVNLGSAPAIPTKTNQQKVEENESWSTTETEPESVTIEPGEVEEEIEDEPSQSEQAKRSIRQIKQDMKSSVVKRQRALRKRNRVRELIQKDDELVVQSCVFCEQTTESAAADVSIEVELE